MAVVATLGTPVGTTSNGVTLTANVPGSAAGDISVMVVAANATATVTVNTPSGWTALNPNTNPTNTGTFVQATFYRVWQSGDASTVNFTLASTGTLGTSGRIQIIPFKLTGANTSAPIEAQNTTASGTIADGGNVPCPSLTSGGAGRLLVCTYGLKTTTTDASAHTWTPPSGMTELADEDTNIANGTTQVTAGVATLTVGSGATGTKNAVPSGGGQAVGTSFLVAPATATSQTANATLAVSAALSTTTDQPTKFQYLQDDFSTDKTATLWPASAGVTVSGGAAHITTDTVLGNNALRSAFAWSLKDSYVQLGMNAPVNTGAASSIGRLIIRANVTGTRLEIRADNATGIIYFENRDSSGTNITAGTDTGVSSMTRDAVAMHCIQIAENGGRTYFQTSPDGVTWTTRRSIVTPSWVTATPNLRADVTAYKDAGAASQVDVDDFNLLTAVAPPPTPPPVEADPTPTPGSGSPTGFIAKVAALNPSHYWPLNNTYTTQDIIGAPKTDLAARGTNTRDFTNLGGVTFNSDGSGATFNGTSTSYLRAEATPDFSLRNAANTNTTGDISIFVCVSFPTYAQGSQNHWIGIGYEGGASTLEWAFRLYGDGQGERDRGISNYYWNPNPGIDIDGQAVASNQGSGAYMMPSEGSGTRTANAPTGAGAINTEHFIMGDYEFRGNHGVNANAHMWYGDANNPMTRINTGAMDYIDLTALYKGGRLFLGRRGDNSWTVKANIRRLAIFNRALTQTEIRTMTDNMTLAEGSLGSSSTPVAPGIVRELTLSSTSNSVTGTWRPPATAGTKAIAFYDLTLTATGQTTQTFTVTNNADAASRTHTFSALSTGVSYTYSVKARSADGTSTAVTSTVSTGTTVPQSPTALTVTNGNAQLIVGWTPPLNNGGSPVTGYDLTYTPAGGSPTTISDITGTSRTITGLTNGVTYSLSVVAKNTVGSSVTPLTGFGTPVSGTSVPTQVGAVNTTAGNGSIQATWSAPPDGGSAIIDYTATVSPGGLTQTVTGTSATFTGLTNGTAYTVAVTARNAIGSSTPTSSGSITPFVLPSAPTGLNLTPGNQTILVAWNAPTTLGTGGVLNYRVTADLAGSVVATVNTTSASTSTTFTGLTNGTTYRVRVFAVSNYGESNPAASTTTPFVLAATPPSIPLNFETVPGVSHAINLTWDPPNSDGGGPITGYALTVKRTSTGAVVDTQSYNDTTFSDTISGLTNGVQYTFILVAINSSGNSPEATSVVTPIAPDAPPGDVQNLTALALGERSVRLSWTAPITGSEVTNYVVSSEPVTQVRTLDANQLSIDLTNLTPDTAYVFTVTALNLFGDSGGTDVSVSTDPIFVPPPPEYPVPNMFAFPQPSPTDTPRVFRPANFGKTIEEVPVGE